MEFLLPLLFGLRLFCLHEYEGHKIIIALVCQFDVEKRKKMLLQLFIERIMMLYRISTSS